MFSWELPVMMLFVFIYSSSPWQTHFNYQNPDWDVFVETSLLMCSDKKKKCCFLPLLIKWGTKPEMLDWSDTEAKEPTRVSTSWSKPIPVVTVERCIVGILHSRCCVTVPLGVNAWRHYKNTCFCSCPLQNLERCSSGSIFSFYLPTGTKSSVSAKSDTSSLVFITGMIWCVYSLKISPLKRISWLSPKNTPSSSLQKSPPGSLCTH